MLKGDLDYDGITDYALSGKRGGKFVIGIVKGLLNSKSKHWTLEFRKTLVRKVLYVLLQMPVSV